MAGCGVRSNDERVVEEQLEALLEEHLKSIGDGPAGQESN